MAFSLEELEAKIKANPYAREFFDLAASYQKLGRLEDAKKVCEKGLEKFPGNFQARLLLTRILIAEGKFKEAKQNVDKVLMVVPDNVSANYLAGDICFSLGDRPAALRYYKVVELFEPGRRDVVEKIAEIEKPTPAAPPEPPPAVVESKIPETEIPAPRVEAVEEEIPTAIHQEEAGETQAAAETSFHEEPQTPEENHTASEESSVEAEAFAPHTASEFVETAASGEDVDEIGSDTLDSLLAETPEADAPVPVNEDASEEFNGTENVPSPPDEVLPGTEEEVPVPEKAVEPAEEKAEEEDASGLNTMTIAELYEKQGYPEKAVEVYQHILLKEPERKDIRLRIENLKDQMLGLTPEGDVIGHDVKSALRRKRIEVLGTWLRKIKEEGNV